VKAAYWDGTQLRTYATAGTLFQGDGVSGTGWNYYKGAAVYDPWGPWDVDSGSEELNGTLNMMGNMLEWMENPHNDAAYGTTSNRTTLGGAYNYGDYSLASSYRNLNWAPQTPSGFIGFRVASAIPEPGTVTLISLGALVLVRKARAGRGL
jgi:sulfatase modifying factor 1